MWLIFMVVLSFMERKSKKKSGNDDKERTEVFAKYTKKKGGKWMSAATLRGGYEGGLTGNDKKLLSGLKKRINESDLSDDEKDRFTVLLSNIDEKDRWGGEEVYTLIDNRLGRKITKEEVDYRIRALNAWRKGEIEEFATREMVELKGKNIEPKVKQALRELLIIGTNKGGICAALAVQNAIHRQYSREDIDKKVEGIQTIAGTIIHI